MIKCVVSDLDGTLLYNGKVSDNNFRAIKLLKDNNIKFIIATGRNENELSLLDLHGDKFPMVMINGALVKDENDLVISSTKINKNVLLDIYKIVSTYKIGTIIYTSSVRYVLYGKRLRDSFFSDIDPLRREIFGDTFFNDLVDIDDYKDINEDIFKFEIMDAKDREMLAEIKKKFLEIDGLSITSSAGNNIEINDYTVSKYNGLKSFMDKFGYTKEEVAVFGDSDNDLSLFENMIETYAVNNASYNIKKNAKYIVDDCKDDGFCKGVIDILRKQNGKVF